MNTDNSKEGNQSQVYMLVFYLAIFVLIMLAFLFTPVIMLYGVGKATGQSDKTIHKLVLLGVALMVWRFMWPTGTSTMYENKDPMENMTQLDSEAEAKQAHAIMEWNSSLAGLDDRQI
jgi:flagellar biosynthesis protein FliP